MNKYLSRFGGLVLVLLLVGGCASVTFHSDADPSGKDVGFLYYPPRPYLVIEPTEKGEKASVVVLPNLSKPMRVRQNPGWGATSFNFATTNGIITSFNATNDSKAAETLTGLMSGVGGILTGAGSISAAHATRGAADSAAEAAVITAIVNAMKAGGAAVTAGRYTYVIEELAALALARTGTLEATAEKLEALKLGPPLEAAAVLRLIAKDLQVAAQLTIEVNETKVDPKSIAAIVEAYGKERERLRIDAKELLRRLDAQIAELTDAKGDYSGTTLDTVVKALEAMESASRVLAKYAGVSSGGGTDVRIYEITQGAGESLLFVPRPLK